MATISHDQKVLKAIGKRSQSASAVAAKLGYPTHHGVSRTLGGLVKNGDVIRDEKGYRKP